MHTKCIYLLLYHNPGLGLRDLILNQGSLLNRKQKIIIRGEKEKLEKSW